MDDASVHSYYCIRPPSKLTLLRSGFNVIIFLFYLSFHVTVHRLGTSTENPASLWNGAWKGLQSSQIDLLIKTIRGNNIEIGEVMIFEEMLFKFRLSLGESILAFACEECHGCFLLHSEQWSLPTFSLSYWAESSSLPTFTQSRATSFVQRKLSGCF